MNLSSGKEGLEKFCRFVDFVYISFEMNNIRAVYEKNVGEENLLRYIVDFKDSHCPQKISSSLKIFDGVTVIYKHGGNPVYKSIFTD